jgi:hypothetical protein
MFRVACSFLLVLVAIPLAAQPGMRAGTCCPMANRWQAASPAPVASNPVVNITGTVSQIQIAPGQGAPYVTVKHGTESTKVFLGPVHYLIAENFNPKAGDEVEIKGYKQADSVIAIQVTLTREKQTLKLRDANGRPLWRGGPWRGGRGRMMGEPPAPAK